MRAHHRGHAVGGVKALVRVHFTGKVRVGGHLPSAQIDRFQPGLDLLNGLIAGEGSQGRHVRFLVQQFPKPVSTHAGEGVFDSERTAQAGYVLGGVRPFDALPSRRGFPFVSKFGRSQQVHAVE